MKRCTKCKLEQPRENFSLRTRAKDRLQSRCRACRAEDNRRWEQSNPEKVAGYTRRWDLANRDKKRVQLSTRRARKLAAFVEAVNSQVVYDRDGGLCGLCFQPVDPTDYHVDHIIPLARGGEHSYANSQVAHPRCNQAKGCKLTA